MTLISRIVRRVGGEDAFWMQPRCSITRMLSVFTHIRRVAGFGIIELWDSSRDNHITAVFFFFFSNVWQLIRCMDGCGLRITLVGQVGCHIDNPPI